MKLINKQIHLPTEFTVAHEDTNDKDLLHLCRLLREFTGIYDQHVIDTFGDLGYYRVLNSSYHVDLTGQAKKGDRIRLEAKATVYPARLLDVSIKAIERTANSHRAFCV